ncbi:EDD domain protein, DegV family [Caminicella sporogenes DSM 14501]|uniref:EDD domain protein, DegV family n=2 Tax=Caminicella TaxID=166484 RepID=A0A1M6MIG2_9FIRM|nr:EDD domain protein, DegV family [Caminicella sporogenes DSM 14501]
MMKIKVIGDSCLDLNEELKKKKLFNIVPLSIRIDDKEFKDDENLDTNELLKMMKNSSDVPKTSSPAPDSFLKAYEGDEDSIFVVTLSSQLSGTYNSAVLAKNMYKEKNEHKFIHVFDSLSASIGETLVGLKILELAKENHTNLEIVEKVNEYIKEMKTFFYLESLDNMIKAGRINKLVAKVATAFSIKPIMGSTEKGTIRLVEKVRGSKKAFKRLVEIIGEQGHKLEEKILGIAHCNSLAKAEKLKEQIKEKYNFKDIIIVEAAGISTVYANEGGIIIAF